MPSDSEDIQSDIANNDPETIQETKAYSETTLTSSPLPSFQKWCLDPSFTDDILINAHMRALQSIEQCGIHHPTLDKDSIKHFDSIAMCYAALEDADNFQKWMERVSEVRSRVNPKQKLVFSKWLSNPVTFPVWGWRRAFCEGDESSDSDSDFGLSTCVNMGMFDSI